MPCAESTSAQLTSHGPSRYGTRLAPLTAVSRPSAALLCPLQLRIRCRSVGRGHPLQQLARLHAASLARSVRSDSPCAILRESLATRGAAYEDDLTLLPTESVTAA